MDASHPANFSARGATLVHATARRPTLIAAIRFTLQRVFILAPLMLGFAPLMSEVVCGPSQARAADDQPEEPLPPQDVVLRTSDNLKLVATYYPSREGKNAVAVILLHPHKGTRLDLTGLAKKLQAAGHAVIAPDLRGHGDTTFHHTGELRVGDYLAMVEDDMETVKKFLIAKNNEGQLNVEKLCVIGIEMGSVIGLNWAAHDWSWPVLANGKQGQDVKAVVVISPEWTFRGLRINDAIAHSDVRSQISMLIVAGKGTPKLYKEAKRLHNALERYHLSPVGETTSPTPTQTLWLRTPQTTLQGTRLLNEKSMQVDDMILKFIDLRLVKQPYPWNERRDPLQ